MLVFMAGRPSKKELILDAAAQVVEDQGGAHLTIDAVAATAGISKGGVLYHYPTKRALLQGMLDRLIETMRSRTETSGSPQGGVHAHALGHSQPFTKREEGAALAVLAASAEDPELLANARAFMREMIDQFKDSPRFVDALLVIVAIEGQRVMEALGILPLSATERNQLVGRILELAEDASK